ncbi:hypothetical protein BC937DRAFT_93940, partial [Endogone sp. FLAS-F59071]
IYGSRLVLSAFQRVEPIGFDSKGNTYWLFDDNRLYKETPAAPPKPKPKPKSRSSKSSRSRRKSVRSSRRSHTTNTDDGGGGCEDDEDEEMPDTGGRGSRTKARGAAVDAGEEDEEDARWRLVCRTEAEWSSFPMQFARSRDPDEKYLHELATKEILPKVLADLRERDKERRRMEAIANRKRSSRILIKELERQEKERMDEVRKQEAEEAAQKRREDVQKRREEKDHQVQIQAREQRLRERELRIRQRERQLRERDQQRKREQERLARERERRASKRRVAGEETEEEDTEMEEADRGEEAREEEEENWIFDCVCGVFGENLDDGTPMIACGRCNVWQHIACLQQDEEDETGSAGRSMKEWESVDFVCRHCLKSVAEQATDPGSSAQASPAPGSHREDSVVPRSAGTEGEAEVTRNGIARILASPSPTPGARWGVTGSVLGEETKSKGEEAKGEEEAKGKGERTKEKDKEKARPQEGNEAGADTGNQQTPVKKKASKKKKKTTDGNGGAEVKLEVGTLLSQVQAPDGRATDSVPMQGKVKPEGGTMMTVDFSSGVDVIKAKAKPKKKANSAPKGNGFAAAATPKDVEMVDRQADDGNGMELKALKKRKRKSAGETPAETVVAPNGGAPASAKKHRTKTPKDPKKAEKKTLMAMSSPTSYVSTMAPNQHSLPAPMDVRQHSPSMSHMPSSPQRTSSLPPPQFAPHLNQMPTPPDQLRPHHHTLNPPLPPINSAIPPSNAAYHHHQTTSPSQYHINGYNNYFPPQSHLPPPPLGLGPQYPSQHTPPPPPPPMQRALYPAPPSSGSGQQLPPLSAIQGGSGSASRSPPGHSSFQIAPRPPIMQPYPMPPLPGHYSQQPMPPPPQFLSRGPPPPSVMQFEQRRMSMEMLPYSPYPPSPTPPPLSAVPYEHYHHQQQPQQRRPSVQENNIVFVSQNPGASSSPSPQRSPSTSKHHSSGSGEQMMPQRLQYPTSPQPPQFSRPHPPIAPAPLSYSHYSHPPSSSAPSGRHEGIPNGPVGDDARNRPQYLRIPSSPKRTAGSSSSGTSPRQKKRKMVPAPGQTQRAGEPEQLPPPELTNDGQIAIPQKGPGHSPKMDIGSLLD